VAARPEAAGSQSHFEEVDPVSRHSVRVRAILIAAATMAAVVIAGCGGGNGGPSSTAGGTVRDNATLQPLGAVSVTTGGASATSAADGTFSLSTTSGTHTIVFAAADYVRREVSATLHAGANDLGTIYLAPILLTGRGAVTGHVYQAGIPAANATIQSGTAMAVAKSDGSFAIYNVRSGQRVLTAVSADAQDSGYAVVQVPDGDTATAVTINLTLSPPGPPLF
jgi:hypothetical protein